MIFADFTNFAGGRYEAHKDKPVPHGLSAVVSYGYSDVYISRKFPLWEQASLRFDVQMFNAFNHPNFALPSSVEAGVPSESIPPEFGTLQSTISPPTGLLGVGLGGDSSPRMIAFQGRIEF